MTIRGLIFDCDGTLADTMPPKTASIHSAACLRATF